MGIGYPPPERQAELGQMSGRRRESGKGQFTQTRPSSRVWQRILAKKEEGSVGDQRKPPNR